MTASPYHPDGEVKNVPGWRLLLSRGASALYRVALKQNLSTFTSCFRVYRRESVTDIAIENGNFLGIAELLGKLLLSRRQRRGASGDAQRPPLRPVKDEDAPHYRRTTSGCCVGCGGSG